MGEKKGDNGDEKNNNNGGEGMHIEILINKKRFEGVESVKVDLVPNKLRVIAEVDLRKPLMVEPKGKKKVKLVSPLQKKDNKKGGGGDGGGGGAQKDEGKPQKKSDDPPVTTALMKLDLHCFECIEKIKKIITKTRGYHGMSIDNQKKQITVKGTMNMKALADALKEKLKKPVEIVPPKKQGGGNNN